MSKYYFECLKCSTQTKDFLQPQCQHSQYYDFLEVLYHYDQVKEFPLKSAAGLKRFLSLLPITDMPVSLNEGNAPVVLLQHYPKKAGVAGQIYVKNEGTNPTGCFKDLESLVVVNQALETGLSKIFVVSSGNAAFSTAAYASLAGLECVCVILEKTHQFKKDGLKSFKVEVKEFTGSYEDAYRYFVDHPLPGFLNVTAGKNPLRIEGDKIVGFEIWEQLGVPDTIVIPIGNGSLLSGIYKSFVELKKLGKINHLPKLVGVQVAGAAPVKQALATNTDYVILENIEDSIAEGIIATESFCSPKAVRAVKNTGGEIVEVNDSEIAQALADINETENLDPEPTAAAVYAALKKIKIGAQEKVVCIQTGIRHRDISSLVKK